MRNNSICILAFICSFVISCNIHSQKWDIHDSLKDSLSVFICDAKAYFGENTISPTCLVVPCKQNEDTLIYLYAFPSAMRFEEDNDTKLIGSYIWDDTYLAIYSKDELDLSWLMNKEPKTAVAFETGTNCNIRSYERTFYVQRGYLKRALPEKNEISGTEIFHLYDGSCMVISDSPRVIMFLDHNLDKACIGSWNMLKDSTIRYKLTTIYTTGINGSLTCTEYNSSAYPNTVLDDYLLRIKNGKVELSLCKKDYAEWFFE